MLLLPSSGDGEGLRRAHLDFGKSTESTLSVTTMSNSGTYPVTPVTSQHSSPTPVAHSYSGHGRADMPPLSTTLGLSSVRSLPHLAVYPALT